MGQITYPKTSKQVLEKDLMMKMPDGSWVPVQKLYREGHCDQISQAICTMFQSGDLWEHHLKVFSSDMPQPSKA